MHWLSMYLVHALAEQASSTCTGSKGTLYLEWLTIYLVYALAEHEPCTCID